MSASSPAGFRRAEKVAQTVARSIVGEIQTRGLQPGHKLPPERDLIETYGVGRGTLREALRLLEVNGLIALRPGPGGGPVVQEVTADDFGRTASLFLQTGGVTYREVVEARLVLEPVAARLAAQRAARTPAAELLQELARIGDTRNEVGYQTKTRDFHAAVIQLSGNGIIALFGECLSHIFRARVSGILYPATRRSEVVNAHAAIADAICEGDDETAQRLMEEHMESFARHVKKAHPSVYDEVVSWQ